MPAVRDDVARNAKPDCTRVTIILDDVVTNQVRAIANYEGIRLAPLLRRWIVERAKRELKKIPTHPSGSWNG